MECEDFDLCTDCFGSHANHKYTVCDALNYPLFPVGNSTTGSTTTPDPSNNQDKELVIPPADDSKSVWTVYEDLKLLRAIQTHGLGNWPDIAEHVRTKTSKRCMERYLDDFLGRHGQILPSLTLTKEVQEDDNETDAERASKRRMAALLRSPSSHGVAAANKKYRAVATESLPGIDWVSTSDKIGTEVGRDVAVRAEQVFLRTIATADDPQAVRLEWEQTRLNKPGGPTALPMKLDDVDKLPGVQVYGYMPRRGDFDIEWDNDAEEAIADMEFFRNESESDRKLKLRVLQIYNNKLEERERRKKFIISRRLYDYTARQQELEKLPRDERDLVLRMRLFERHHTVSEHQQFIASLLKAKRLRKRIAKLQMYRRMGIKTLADAERYELDKARRNQSAANAESEESSYFKQYKTSDRKIRKSVNRGSLPLITAATPQASLPSQPGAPDIIPDDAEAKMKADLASVTQNQPLGDIIMDDATSDQTKPEPSKPKVPETMKEESKDDLRLLSRKEQELCKTLDITASLYLKVKRALIQKSFSSKVADQGSLVKIDVERKGAILEFVVKAGWVPSSFGSPEDAAVNAN